MRIYDFKVVENPHFPLWKYAWVDITRYCVPGLSVGFIATALFARLLNHQIYRRAYYGTPLEAETQNTHGSFVINPLKPSWIC